MFITVLESLEQEEHEDTKNMKKTNCNRELIETAPHFLVVFSFQDPQETGWSTDSHVVIKTATATAVNGFSGSSG